MSCRTESAELADAGMQPPVPEIEHPECLPAVRLELAALNDCGLPTALEAMGERWSFLTLRAAFSGVHHFEEFQSTLGIARNILANRLGRLVDHGILTREALAADRRKVEYRLTDKGVGLLPAMVALRQWGEKWCAGAPSSLMLVDERDHQPIRPLTIQAHDGRALELDDLCWAQVGDVRTIATVNLRSVA